MDPARQPVGVPEARPTERVDIAARFRPVRLQVDGGLAVREGRLWFVQLGGEIAQIVVRFRQVRLQAGRRGIVLRRLGQSADLFQDQPFGGGSPDNNPGRYSQIKRFGGAPGPE